MTVRLVSFIAALGVPFVAAAQAPRVAAPRSSRDSLQMICAPLSPSELPQAPLRVTGGTVPGRVMFSAGDPLILNGGSDEGVRPGQQYSIRRVVEDRYADAGPARPIGVHTVGWVRVVQVTQHTAVATVGEACDGVYEGDYLDPYVPPVVPESDSKPGDPDFTDPARVVLGDERRQMGAAGSLMLIDRGSDAGLHAGQIVTIYRETLQGEGPILTVGRAVILNVRPQTSLIRIESSREAVYLGDLAAVHRMK